MLRITLIILAIFLIIPSMAESTEYEMLKLLPNEIHGWKAYEKPKTYNRQTIYDYMNGAGEMYLAYGYKRLIVRKYTRALGPDIVVEIFDMSSSEDAFGIFSHVRGNDDREMDIGQGSEYRKGLLFFWKSKFFVCIRAERETQRSKKAVIAMGKKISKAIKAKGEKPDLLNYLPEDEFSEKSLRYFHMHEILNYHYYVADRNILNLNENTKAALVRYKDDRSFLLLIQYQNTDETRKAFESFLDAYMPDAKRKGIIQTENGRWTAALLEKNFIVIIFDALSRAESSYKADMVRNRLK